jgi:hypothetical protein
MRPMLIGGACMVLTLVAAVPSFAPPPSDLCPPFGTEEAWEKSCEALGQLFDARKLREYRIYVLPETVAGGYVVKVPYAKPLSGPDAESWLFFVDEIPPANWGHPCRLVFVTTDAYETAQYECQFPPDNFGEFLDVTEKVLAFLRE